MKKLIFPSPTFMLNASMEREYMLLVGLEVSEKTLCEVQVHNLKQNKFTRPVKC